MGGMQSRLRSWITIEESYWINLQSRYDMDLAEDALSDKVAREVRPLEACA